MFNIIMYHIADISWMNVGEFVSLCAEILPNNFNLIDLSCLVPSSDCEIV